MYIRNFYVSSNIICFNKWRVPFFINNGKCPNPQELGHFSLNKGQNYKRRKVETIAHLPKSPHPEAYYEMAKHYCGKERANKSWVVEVLFPQYLPSYDAGHRQIFINENKNRSMVCMI